MPTPEETARQLESAVNELRAVTSSLRETGTGLRPATSDPSSFVSFEIAERMVNQLSTAKVFTGDQREQFQQLASTALQERLRALARGTEAARAINITVSGTATIST